MQRIQHLVPGIIVFLTLSAATAQSIQEMPADNVSLGFERGDLGKIPDGWFVPTKGWKAELSEAYAAKGKRSVKLFLPGKSAAPFGNLMRSIDIDEYKGKHVRLSAKIRLEGSDDRAQMWLRVDRPNQQLGFFDNMHNRPIRAARWTDAVIEGDIDQDGIGMVCGIMSLGGGTVFVDDVELTVSAEAVPTQEASPPQALTERGLDNLRAASRLLAYVRFFHPSDGVLAVEAWDHFAIEVMKAAESAQDATELATRLRSEFASIAPGLTIWAGDEAAGPEPPKIPEEAQSFRYWVHYGAGRVAMQGSLYSSETKTIRRDELGKEPAKSGGLLKSLTKAFKGDDTHHRPQAPFVTKPLGGGITCRLPIMVAVGRQGTFPKATEKHLWDASSVHPTLTAANRSTRLAGVAICWGVMQHFYPYFDVVDTDWDEALDSALRQAAEDTDERSYLRTLQRMFAKLHDGHAGVYGQRLQPTRRLPLQLEWAGSDCVVVGKHESVTNEVGVGDAIVALDGKPFSDVCEDLSSRASAATDGWRRQLLLRLFTSRVDSDPCKLRMRKPDGSEYEVSVTLVEMRQPIKKKLRRPENGEELDAEIVYFDLNGTDRQALEKAFETLAAADGIVFDLRGYPGDAAFHLLPHLIKQRAASAQWNVPVVTLPDGKKWSWRQSAWDLRPSDTPLGAEIAFLTDGRAISYAELIMGIVEHYKLGEIVGSATAGTNGNVNPFSLPGGYRVSWTGMKVLKHDGSQHHGVGILPSVPVEPTAQGIAAGRDEVLEKAIEVLQQRIAE